MRSQPVAQRQSPSPIVEVFVRAVRAELPTEQAAKLGAYESRIAATTDAEDARRARHCARWAIDLASGNDLGHPDWRRIQETHELWKDLWFGVQYAGMGDDVGRPAPVRDVEIEWVEDAVRVAQHVGTATGWEHSPWDQLLEDLLAMEPAGSSGSPR